MLGLARRSGKVATGDMAVRQAVMRGRAQLIILAGDAGASTARTFRHLATTNGCALIQLVTKSELGRAIGLASTAVVAVLDAQLAKGLARTLQTEGSVSTTGVDE